jgi:Transposase zinc-ribbon domain
MVGFPRSLIEFQRHFPDERACASYLAVARWPDGFRCPSCGHDRGWELTTKAFTWECALCGKQTSVTAGTMMHGSKLSLTAWFWGAWLMATHSNGMSARQLWRQLGLGSYKSAWLLCAKLRRAMVAPHRSPLAGLVEIDETVIPHRTKADPPAGGQGAAPMARC